jgi:hypothetical protein
MRDGKEVAWKGSGRETSRSGMRSLEEESEVSKKKVWTPAAWKKRRAGPI